MKTNTGIRNTAWAAAAAALLGVLALTAPGIGQQGEPAGQKLYKDYCALCHGEQGDGRGIAAPSMGRKLNDFGSSAFWSDRSDKKLIQVILKGQGRMPAQPVSPDEAKVILEYMKTAFKGKYGS
jgi:mono/diheme cytochrome c family protein